MPIRTRMAPSPTGEYHIGHIRTLLYDYALAKKDNGIFIIRIEDTDRNRYVEGAVERILDVIEDYGFSWDEGPKVGGPYKPYVQSERLPIYKEKAEELVKKGNAYYCFCTKERLEKLRDEQRKQGLAVTKYDKHCLGLSKEEVAKKLEDGEPHVIRLNVPQDEAITFTDEVYGDITVNSNDIDDQVLLKSDGFPTYHLGVVVDDHLMNITHIMRGIDWLPSTPKHILLYRAFGWELPVYIHLPNLKELGGSRKLSKRFGSVYASDFLKEGYLSEAVVNFLMFLGWNPGTEKEIYTLDEFISDFSIDRIQKTDLVSFDRKKLLWYNGQYIRALSNAELLSKLKMWSDKYNIELIGSDSENEKTLKVVGLVKERLTVLSEFNNLVEYFFVKPQVDREELYKYTDDQNRANTILSDFVSAFSEIDKITWTEESLEKKCKALLDSKGYSPKEAYMTLRVSLTGRSASPHIFDVLAVLGKDETLDRIKSVLH